MHSRRPVFALAALPLLAALALPGCVSTLEQKQAAAYGPTESILEVVAVLRRHVPDDTYRFDAAADFSGRNVYRASLLRLENLERVHAESLRAGHLDGVIAFAKARALERLRAYDLAADHYEVAAKRDDTLRNEARASAAVCDRFAEAVAIGIDPVDPLSSEPRVLPIALEDTVLGFDERTSLLEAILELEDVAPHYHTIARQEIERADESRADYFEALRFALPEGHLRAVSERQRMLTRHGASARSLKHMLRLANLYASMSREYVSAVPPTSLSFDPPRFASLVDAAAQLYQRVASEDGRPEKLEAARRLEAFLAFTLQVDRDRFTQ